MNNNINNNINNNLNNNMNTNMSNNMNQPNTNINNNNNMAPPQRLHRKKKKTPILLIVGIIIGVIVIGFVIKNLLPASIGGSHVNNTGSLDYTGANVTFNCVYTEYQPDKERTFTDYVDILANYNGYGYVEYIKTVYEYSKYTTIPDDVFCNMIRKFEGTSTYGHVNDQKCDYKNDTSVDLGIVDAGMYAKLERSGNQIIYTNHKLYSINQTASKSDIQALKKAYEEKGGYTCK